MTTSRSRYALLLLLLLYHARSTYNTIFYIKADKLQTLTKAAGFTEIEPIWFSLYAKALEGQDLKELIWNVGAPAAGGAGAAAAGGAAAAEEAKEEEKKEEEKEESDEDMGFGKNRMYTQG